MWVLNLLVAVGDAAAIEIVGRELDLHTVAGEDADVVAPHLARDVPEDLVFVVQLHLEHRVGQRLGDLALHLDLLFLGHRPKSVADGTNVPRTWPCPAPPRGRTSPPASGPRSRRARRPARRPRRPPDRHRPRGTRERLPWWRHGPSSARWRVDARSASPCP